ncbi:MAG: type IV pilus assembly protein PilM [Candidatus Colwellbacteria bacterium]|nr:type IV pilus assembly protein PilM [Candidatus Colwellbacteria bacterium]
MVTIPFLKKIALPKFSFRFLAGKPSRVVGVDIGTYSTKVVQLRYERERAILETYGELINSGYFKTTNTMRASGFLRYSDKDIIALLRDVMKEAHVTAKDVVVAIPSGSSFVTSISLPLMQRKEMDNAVPYEARKYIPIPISEVTLDWEVLETDTENNVYKILIAAVPREVIDKFRRVLEAVGLNPRALEIETFSLIRSLIGHDPTPTAIINIGYSSIILAVVDRMQLRISRNFGHGAQEITRTLERGLGVTAERAEAMKQEIGLSQETENREIASIISPIVEVFLSEIERNIALYNRKASRKIQKINLTGGGSNLNGLVAHISSRLGLEVTKGNPFIRIITPAFMQPILREIGPSLSVAAGLALREITIR